jgi:segregation and condensation protein B
VREEAVSEFNPKPIIEALLFATTEPLQPKKIAEIVKGCDTRTVRRCIDELKQEYDQSDRGFAIQEVAGGYQILSREQYGEYVHKLHKGYAQARLSQAALETLAVIAYKQPVLRAEIDAIRGVNSGPLLRSLIDRGLVKIVGRADTLGRPVLYGTTKKFLERFLLNSLKELPEPEAIEALQEVTAADAAAPVEAGAPDGTVSPDGQAQPAGEQARPVSAADLGLESSEAQGAGEANTPDAAPADSLEDEAPASEEPEVTASPDVGDADDWDQDEYPPEEDSAGEEQTELSADQEAETDETEWEDDAPDEDETGDEQTV